MSKKENIINGIKLSIMLYTMWVGFFIDVRYALDQSRSACDMVGNSFN